MEVGIAQVCVKSVKCFVRLLGCCDYTLKEEVEVGVGTDQFPVESSSFQKPFCLYTAVVVVIEVKPADFQGID